MSKIHIIPSEFNKELELQLAYSIKAGFPSPAEDYQHETLDFNRDLIKHPEATFYGRVDGDSMIDAGINDGDIAIIDRSVEASDGDNRKDISNYVLQTKNTIPSESTTVMISRCGV